MFDKLWTLFRTSVIIRIKNKCLREGVGVINMETIQSEKNKQYISLLDDIRNISKELGIKTYIWGGMTIDIWEGRFLREHGDLDGFTENLVENLPYLTEMFQCREYEISFNNEFLIFEVKKGIVHASFNPLKRNAGIAEWQHIGNEGSVYFPYEWLDQKPRDFYNTKVYTSGLKFEYAMKTKIEMLHPKWQLRQKDKDAISYMQEKLKGKNIQEDIYKWFWSYNPFWYKQGYEEFFRPTIAYPINPK